MANEQNLVTLTPRQAREIGAKGGRASAEAKKRRKAMREQMETLLSLPLSDQKIKDRFKAMGIEADDMDNQMALVVSTFNKALKGDTSAINIVREMVGERVTEMKITTDTDEKVNELENILQDMNE